MNRFVIWETIDIERKGISAEALTLSSRSRRANSVNSNRNSKVVRENAI